MTLPTQIAYVPEDRAAIAPYNFVPLPEKVVSAQLPLPTHDVYHADRHTGRIECTLTTASPLYVRCGYTPQEYAELAEKPFNELNEEQQRKRAQFFHLGDPDAPIIPGSSLRGMLRALVEIAGYGKMEKVIDRQLFYRSVSDQTYQRLFVEDCGKIQRGTNPWARCFRSKIRAGFLRLRSGGYIIEECDFARIDHKPNARGIGHIPRINGENWFTGRSPGGKPNWIYQNKHIYVSVDQQEQDYFFPTQYRPNGQMRHPDLYLRFRAVKQASFVTGHIPNAQDATLVITGPMQNKHMEFVFIHKVTAIHVVDQALVQRFEDDDQLTQWQEGAFPHDRPVPNARRSDGLLRDGEPIFFLMDDTDQLVRFFGRAQLFRLPYGTAPSDFVPPSHNVFSVVDLAQAIFGAVPSSKQEQGNMKPIAGRVFASDALFVCAKDGMWLDEIIPHILGSPKPTTYQHYLVQPIETKAEQRNLMRYDSQLGKTTIRGHKLYWHKGNTTGADIKEPDEVDLGDTQHTQFRPVNSGVTFSFNIHFENLSTIELGALLWVLRLCDDAYTADKDGPYRFKLGMGKPLGMGAVKIDSKVVLSTREERYTRLFNGDLWATGEQAALTIGELEAQKPYIRVFEQYVLQESGDSSSNGTLAGTFRMQSLRTLLTWPGPNPKVTRYMEIERDADHPDGVRPGRENNGKVNEYSNRLVLPDPRQVMELPESTTRHRSSPKAAMESPKSKVSHRSPPKAGNDRQGKIKEREGRTWIVTLEGDFTVRATLPKNIQPFPRVGDKVSVRITGQGDTGEIRKILPS